MDGNDEEAITNNKFNIGRSKSPGKGSRKMEGYYETIEGRGGGIVGSAAGTFSLVCFPNLVCFFKPRMLSRHSDALLNFAGSFCPCFWFPRRKWPALAVGF